ncbi:MAG TPA: MmgE/PrpD family protein [Bryobacteraceae bacterium]|nr:MmgE/PrpD family protein [Bryobacteraceae bacterium]
MIITRRSAFKHAGGVLAAAAASGFGRAAEVPVSAVTTRLSTYMSEAAGRSLPDEVVEKTKHHIIDTFAAMISGADLPPARIALKFARAHAGEKVATVAASNIVCGAIDAALANGMLAHSDETDDSHAPSHSHPGCAVVPAALAAGEHFGIDGTRFLRAVALGYDIGPRVTLTLGGLPYQMETHHSAHSIAEDFGAAAAAGCAAGLDAHQMRWLLDYAAQQAGGIAAWERDTEHVEKSLVFAGWPARNGVTAALLIQLGGSGVEDILSGPDNFLMAFAPKADPAKLIEKLGERYEVTRTSIKKWTVGSPIQAPLDALQNMLRKRPFDADQVQSAVVRVATSEANTVNNREMPDICLQHMIAVMLIDKTASFQAAHDKGRMKNPEVLRVRAKVRLIPDEELERLYPKRETRVEVTLHDGTRLTERVEAVRGTPENPMTRDEVVAKCRDLTEPSLGKTQSAKLIEAVLNIERVRNLRELRPLLQKI